MARVVLTDPALDDLRRARAAVARRAAARADRACSTPSPSAGTPLVDRGTGYRDARRARRRRRGSCYEPPTATTVTVREVWVDGVRTDGEAYAEALERMRAADPSEQVDAGPARSQRLGRLTGARPVPSDRLRAPVPDWLADALVATPAWTRLAVAAMDATTAFDAWNPARSTRTVDASPAT